MYSRAKQVVGQLPCPCPVQRGQLAQGDCFGGHVVPDVTLRMPPPCGSGFTSYAREPPALTSRRHLDESKRTARQPAARGVGVLGGAQCCNSYRTSACSSTPVQRRGVAFSSYSAMRSHRSASWRRSFRWSSSCAAAALSRASWARARYCEGRLFWTEVKSRSWAAEALVARDATGATRFPSMCLFVSTVSVDCKPLRAASTSARAALEGDGRVRRETLRHLPGSPSGAVAVRT